MNPEETLNGQQLLMLAQQQGDPKTIAAWLNHHLNHLGIRARVAWRDAYLGLLLEAVEAPTQLEMVEFVKKSFAKLQLESVQAVRVYGRKIGQVTPVWCEELALQKAPPSDLSVLSLADWLSQGVKQTADKEQLPPRKQSIETKEQTKFLRFYFSSEDTALLPLSNVKEVLHIQIEDILPVPHMPDCLLGIYNLRGEMIWLVDLAEQLGFTSHTATWQCLPEQLQIETTSVNIFDAGSTDEIHLNNSQTVITVVIQDKDKFLGIVVPQVIDIEIHNLENMQYPSAELFSPAILPFVAGYLTRSSSPVLSVAALITDPQLQMYLSHV